MEQLKKTRRNSKKRENSEEYYSLYQLRNLATIEQIITNGKRFNNKDI
jgi:hypothetical protein